MKTWVALLRGINVVGRNQVPMKALAVAFERAGFRSVRTYLQSGNVVFQSRSGTPRALGARIAQLVLGEFGFEPRVMVIDGEALATAIRGNPFPAAHENHKLVHLYFLAGSPQKPDLAALAKLEAGREQFALKGEVFYLYTPDGFADSVLQSRVERCLGVAATARNWRTASELLKMLS
ncbi:MAG: DUF1697 domain-containing protein [Steroidobacteraceae bacterium]